LDTKKMKKRSNFKVDSELVNAALREKKTMTHDGIYVFKKKSREKKGRKGEEEKKSISLGVHGVNWKAITKERQASTRQGKGAVEGHVE